MSCRDIEREHLRVREQIARLTATDGHQANQLKEARAENRTLQAELLTLARAEPKGG
jgi:hypothetical protein